MVGVPAGRRTKWLVLVFWLVVVALAGPLSGKLTGAEKNDAQSWLPPKAESTQVLALRSKVVSPNVYPAVVVYDRPGGLTAADKAKAAADARRFAGVAGVVQGQVAGPFVARDGKAIETIVPVNLGHNGWNGAGTAADSLRSIAASGSQGLTIHIAGPLGYAADSGKAFKGIDGTLLFSALAVVIVLLLITYRSPILWLLPVISAGVALISRPGADLPAGRARRADRQRAERGHPGRAGVRRRHRLRAAADRQVPRGAAAARGPACRRCGWRSAGPGPRSSPAPAR